MYIKVKNTRIEIYDYQLGYCSKLENILSIWNKATFNYSFRSFIYNEKKSKLILPGGMSVNYICKLLSDPDIPIKYIDDKYDSNLCKAYYTCKVEPRDDIQIDSLNFLQDSLINKNFPQALLCLRTGTGKSYTTIRFLAKNKLRAIVITDMARLIDQWQDEFIKFTNLTKYDIYKINEGRNNIDKLFKMKNPNYKVYIASHRTLSNYAKENGFSSINQLFKKLNIAIKVYDEAHVEWVNIFNINSYTNTHKTLYLTATPGRSNHDEDRVYQITYNNIPKFNGNEYGVLESSNSEVYHRICYVNFSSNAPKFISQELSGKYGLDVNKYADYCFNQAKDNYMKVILKLINLVKNKNGKIAIILVKNDNVKFVYDYLCKKIKDKTISIYTSLINDKDEKLKALEKDIIITTQKSLGKALNVDNLKFMISLVPTSSRIVTEQLLGRLRKNVKGIYFDLLDTSIRQCVIQRYRRKRTLDRLASETYTLQI